jgi:hypothetical protein
MADHEADHEIDELRGFEWMQSRIPALDALVHFVPDAPRDAEVDAFATSHRSRWYPVEGGTHVVVSMDGEPDYDPSKWKVEKGAWDHEHCDLCSDNIPAMTLCWVTRYDPYVLLCDACHAEVLAAGGDS